MDPTHRDTRIRGASVTNTGGEGEGGGEVVVRRRVQKGLVARPLVVPPLGAGWTWDVAWCVCPQPPRRQRRRSTSSFASGLRGTTRSRAAAPGGVVAETRLREGRGGAVGDEAREHGEGRRSVAPPPPPPRGGGRASVARSVAGRPSTDTQRGLRAGRRACRPPTRERRRAGRVRRAAHVLAEGEERTRHTGTLGSEVPRLPTLAAKERFGGFGCSTTSRTEGTCRPASGGAATRCRVDLGRSVVCLPTASSAAASSLDVLPRFRAARHDALAGSSSRGCRCGNAAS